MSAALIAMAIVVGAPGALAVSHLTVLSVASLGYRRPRARDPQPWRLLVLVPARNEELLVGRAVASLVAQRRPGDLVVVVADRCTDGTAARARAEGAEVVERPSGAEPGKSAAMIDALGQLTGREWDALVIMDADCVAGDRLLASCERILQAGAGAAQARTESVDGGGMVRQANVVAMALQGVTLPRGRDRLGASARLKGAGMIVRRDVLTRHPLARAAMSEDTQYGLELIVGGVRARHCDDGVVRAESTRRLDVYTGQRARQEAGRVRLARAFIGPLVRRRTVASFEAALYLASPPIAVAVLLLVVAGALFGLAGNVSGALVAVALVAFVGLDVALALVVTRAGPRTWAAVALAPGYVVWKAGVQVRALLSTRRPAQPFEPTARD